MNAMNAINAIKATKTTLTTIIACVVSLLLAATQVAAADVTAEVDTHKLQQGDSLVLTVTVNERAFGKQPDFSALKEQFKIINTVNSSSVRMINGQMESSLSWRLTLVPKVTGYIVIPPIEYDGKQTRPITIQVVKRAAGSKRSAKNLVFIEANVDKKEVYVQEQVVLTLRLYKRTQIIDPAWTPPNINDAVMERLSDSRSYQTNIDGYTYQVTENTFAVFPQKSGTLVIPESQLMATIGTGSRGGFFFDPFSASGKQIRRTTEQIDIKVKPIPDGYPNVPWLPSSSVALADQWSPQKPQFEVGEAVTRTIILQAKGLTATALPPLPAPQSDKFKVYPDKADTQSRVDADGMLSQRVESYAFIPTEPGTITLPEVQVSWWDVTRDELKTATLPAQTIQVEGAANVQRTDQTLSAPPSVSTTPSTAPPSVGGSEATVSTTWQWLAVASLALWLLTLVALFWVARKRKTTPAHAARETTTPSINLKEAKKQLRQACQQNDPKAAQQALINWAKGTYPEAGCLNLGDVIQLVACEKCRSAIKELEILLYRSESYDNWDGTYLWEAIEELSKAQANKEPEPALAPLYPTQ